MAKNATNKMQLNTNKKTQFMISIILTLIAEMECRFVRLCVRRLPEDGTPLPKHVVVIPFMNCVLWFVFYCTVSSVFVGQSIEVCE
jgi:hypothetical protein